MRLFGVLLIWAGDGSTAVWRRALVVVGVVLSVGGIAVLRYLLLSDLLTRRRPSPSRLPSREWPYLHAAAQAAAEGAARSGEGEGRVQGGDHNGEGACDRLMED